jgi:hypothetical protein
MQEIYDAKDRAHAEQAIEAFARTYGVKWPKAVAKITDDAEGTAGVLRLPGRALDPPEDHGWNRQALRQVYVVFFDAVSGPRGCQWAVITA